MNYIKEINAFYDRQEQIPLSSAAVALWYALMHINNKTRWKNTFTSPGSVLRNKSGLSESSFKRARTELVELGYIEVKSQGRGRAPFYTMRSLVVEISHAEDDAVEVLSEKEAGKSEEHALEYVNENGNEQLTHQVDEVMNDVSYQLVDQLPAHDSAPLYKQYINKTKTKQSVKQTAAAEGANAVCLANEKKHGKEALKFYEANFGKASPFIQKACMEWGQTLDEELIIEAMKRALEQNKLSWAYVKGVLNNWHQKGIRTLEQVEEERVVFEKKRMNKQSRGGLTGGGGDIIPDWFTEERQSEEESTLEEWGMTKEDMEIVEDMLREYEREVG